jgi:hypothetical protein
MSAEDCAGYLEVIGQDGACFFDPDDLKFLLGAMMTRKVLIKRGLLKTNILLFAHKRVFEFFTMCRIKEIVAVVWGMKVHIRLRYFQMYQSLDDVASFIKGRAFCVTHCFARFSNHTRTLQFPAGEMLPLALFELGFHSIVSAIREKNPKVQIQFMEDVCRGFVSGQAMATRLGARAFTANKSDEGHQRGYCFAQPAVNGWIVYEVSSGKNAEKVAIYAGTCVNRRLLYAVTRVNGATPPAMFKRDLDAVPTADGGGDVTGVFEPIAAPGVTVPVPDLAPFFGPRPIADEGKFGMLKRADFATSELTPVHCLAALQAAVQDFGEGDETAKVQYVNGEEHMIDGKLLEVYRPQREGKAGRYPRSVMPAFRLGSVLSASEGGQQFSLSWDDVETHRRRFAVIRGAIGCPMRILPEYGVRDAPIEPEIAVYRAYCWRFGAVPFRAFATHFETFAPFGDAVLKTICEMPDVPSAE